MLCSQIFGRSLISCKSLSFTLNVMQLPATPIHLSKDRLINLSLDRPLYSYLSKDRYFALPIYGER